MSREVQLTHSDRLTDPLAYSHVPSATPRQTGTASRSSNFDPQVPAWTADSAKGQRSHSHERDAGGKRLAVIESAKDGPLQLASRLYSSFSRKAERLVTHDYGCLRVWETRDFSELCRRRLRSDRQVVGVSFCEGSASEFVVFFNDFSESVFSIDEDGTSTEWFIRQGWDRSADPPLPDGWSLSDTETVRLISDDEAQRIFVNCAEVGGLGLVLSVKQGEERVWRTLSFAEPFGQDFVYRRAQWGGDALLVTGRQHRASGSLNCVALFRGFSSGETEFVSLEGGAGRLAQVLQRFDRER